MEQYSRKQNLRISGIDEEANETIDVLEAKIIKLAGDIGVELKPDDISGKNDEVSEGAGSCEKCVYKGWEYSRLATQWRETCGHNPDDLQKLGITTPDWENLTLGHLAKI
ncbi:hypothetical protein E2C01_097932 [Portunus trituberculatus]|uniref:Uncharacterized protein n=1 Tax=Portunus trituberculatus TaxID=210409 RepID=A0A5B7K6X5_PORTR|nr:hypothetical protein [Portunus trituberculatus]